MNKKLAILAPSLMMLALPLSAFAAVIVPGIPGQISSFAGSFQVLFTVVWQLFAVGAIIMFLIAGFLFLTAEGDPSKLAKARGAVLWGVVGIAVGILAFSIPFVIQNALGL